MERKKDISKLIKANEHRLSEVPSNRAWKKLESRLDAHKNKHQSSLYRQLAMIAAVVALVAIVSLLSLMQHRERDLMAMNEESYSMPHHLEVIESYTDVDHSVYHISEFQRKYKGTTTINEGPRGKQLIPSPKFASNKEIEYYVKAEEKQPKAIDNTDTDKASFSIESITTSDTKKLYANAAPPATPENKITEVSGYNIMLEDDFEEELAATMPEALSATSLEPPAAAHDIKKDSYEHEIELAGTSKKEISEKERRLEEQIKASNILKAKEDAFVLAEAEESATTEALAKSSSTVASSRAKKRKFKHIDAHSNAIQIDAFPEQSNLKLFKWLIGQWHGTTNNGLSIEEWKQKDEFTIQGTGCIIVNGDTTFTEGMRIQKIDQDLYYILTLDQSKAPVQFKLKSYTNQQAVFENSELAFPNQVILQQNNVNNFSTILQNKAPAQINLGQQQYIQNRNQIQNEQAVRNLSRIKQ